MRFSINSRVLNETFDFWAPDNGGYVRLEKGHNIGTLGHQICHEGRLSGSTVSCAGSQDEFERICRNWYRSHMRRVRDIY